MKSSNRSIGLALNQANLYPPLLSPAPSLVAFTTELPAGEEIEFSLVANGAPGVPAGIDLRPGSHAGGMIWVHPGFIANHPGSWPVQLMLQASRNGEIVDTATLWLHDTRQMKVHRIEGELLPNPAHVSDTETVLVLVRATFYDHAGLEVPRAEVSWAVVLPDSPPDLVVDGDIIRIAPRTAEGGAQVRISEASGASVTLPLTLKPPLDIGFEASPRDVYPPVRGVSEHVLLTTSLPPESDVQFDYLLNGEDGQHMGLFLESMHAQWVLSIYAPFMQTYQGPWPAEIAIHAVVDGQQAGTRTVYLHDTRNVVCTKLEVAFRPSDTVHVPATGSTLVRGVPIFYDAQGIQVPLVELDYEAALDNEPLPGIERHKHILTVLPTARPGIYRLTIQGPDDLSASEHLTLT
ncbi:hypothetical protein [Stenotrophomonas sp.]|uniref:hypothetical protein n=1 Tax=Stenotrophomonas sp. TaxID=69392 RepID=UPI0028A9414E|nr:hypothetical protein [Stenotrophomonas sp.]